MKPSPTLTLWRPQPEGHATALLEALITPSARRKQQLMGEDCITLDFLHDQLVELSVGDYVDTDYGRFYVATPQRATFEAETAVYHYLITLEAPHRLWGTHLMALCVAQSEGSYVRTDKQWTLTAPLSQHLDQLVANLKILGIAHPDGSNWDYVVHQESFLHTNATAARTLVYDGCSLLQALDLLASEEAYHCEWWIDGHTIHFGQLGTGQASAATIVQGRNGHFERDKESLIATRHYVVGGTTNLPNTYRRKLIFEADGELLKKGIIHDPARPLRPMFFSNFDKGLQERKVEHRFSMEQLKLFTSVGVVEGRNDDPNADDYDPNVPSEQGEDHRQADVVLWSDEQARFTFKEGVHYNLDAKGLRLLSQQQPKGVMGETAVLALAWQALPHEKGADVVEVDGKRLRIFFRLGGAGTFDAVDTQYPASTTRQGLYLLTTDSFLETPETADLRIEGSVKLYYAEPAAQMRLRVSVPSAGIDNAEARYADTFTDNAPEHALLLVDEGLRGQLPSINSEFVPHGLVSAKIPLSYYIPEHHIEGLGAAPANSLRLPLEAYPNGYIDLPADATEAQRVERVLALPHIFPRLEMNVGEVVMDHKAAKSENESAQPHFSITDASNSLPFESSLRIEGVALRVKFESGALGGMEFVITPDFTNKRFAITPNENYGAMLPNATLHPVSGDKFVLLGFNPEVLADGGLVEAAERELERVAREIIEQEQALSQSYELTTLPPLNPLDDAPIYRLGQSLTLSDDGSSTKPLRIVGVDHALDIPQDAPRYRLAQPRKPSLTQRLKEVGTAKASGTKVVTAGQVGGNNGRSFSTSSSSVDIDALREEMGEHFLSRLSPDVALGHITFNNGLTAKQLANLEKGATFGSYLPSLIGGSGAKIDERGNAEVESIKVRSRMEVAELVVNRQTTMDADFLLTEGDLVENVKEEANGQFTLTLRREWEGYVTSLTAGAVVRGIYNDITRGGGTFETTWLKVLSVDSTNNAIRVSLYPNSDCPARVNYAPRPLLRISRWGHVSDELRQATYLLSSREQRVCLLTNVTKPIIDASNISSWQGKLDGLTWRDAGGQTHQLTGYGNVMGSAYISGSLHVGGELTGAIADKVNELGEENLLLEGNVPVRNSDYMTARYSLSKNGQTLKEGEKITAVMKAHLADGRDRFGAFVADGWISVARFEPIGNDLYKFTHVWPTRVSKEGKINDNRSLQIYAIPSNSATTTIEWVKLVRGSHASLEFSPSPEDVANAPILKARAERIIAEVEAEKSRLAAEYAKVHQLAQWSGEEGSRVINLNINYKAKADELLKAAQSFIADGLILTSIFDKKIPKSLQDEYRQTAVQLIAALREMQGKIEVGGVNLFGFHKGINLKCESWESDKLGLDLEWAPDIKGVRARVTKAGDGFIRLENYGLREHVMCTFSFRMNYPRTETKKIVNARIYTAREAKSRNVIPQAGWQYVTITALGGQLMTYNNSGIADIHFQKGNSLQVGDIIEIADIKIERGTVATAWTPAPEDVEWEKQQTLTKINNLQTSLDKAKSDLTTITDDAWRDGIITAAEGKSLTKAKLELLKSEKSYLLARADAVLAAHPQLATTHPTEYNQIREGSASNQNARWYYLLYAEGMINACEAFLAGNSSYIFNGGSKPTATRYEDLFSLWLSSKSLSEWYEFSRNSFEAAIIMADRGKDGARGERGLQGLQGEQGERGIPGERGADGRSSYTHIAYADNEHGDGFSQDPNGKDYIGMYVDDQATDSNNPSDYRWSLIKGQRGEQGIAGRDGRNGENGKTAYLHIAYANSADGRTDFHLSDPTNRAYIGTYTDHDINDSEDPSDYRWSLIKGEKGDKGDTGKNGKDGRPGRDGVGVSEVKPQYAITSSATSPPNNNSDVGWSDTPIPWREGFALWTRQKTTYTDGRVNYSTPILDNSWSGERLRRLMEDDLAVSKVSVGAEKGVAFAGRFLACENDGGNRVVRAFFNGQTSGTRPAFAAGVNHFGEDGESYSTAFYHNGSGHIGVLSFDNIGGAGSLHIFDRNDARKKLVELTDKPMPDAVQMAKENRVEVKYGRNGNFNQTFTGVNAGEPLYLGPDSSGWDGRGEIFSKPTDPEYDQDGLPHDRYDVYQIIPQWGAYNVDGNLRIPDGNPTGAMSGSLSIRVTPSATRQTLPNGYDSWGGFPNDRVAVYLINYSDGPRGYKLWDNGKDGELMSGDVNLSFLKDIVPGEYQLQVIITSYVGRPKVNISGSGVSYFIDPNRPYTAICGDGFMAYQSQQQYTFIKDGVLHAKGELRIPGLLAAGVVEVDGTFRSSWGSRLSHVEHRSRGEYLIHHTLGHTRYSVIVNPLGNGGLKVAQLAAHAGHVAWIYIKDVQSGCQMSDSMFTFAIIGHDD